MLHKPATAGKPETTTNTHKWLSNFISISNGLNAYRCGLYVNHSQFIRQTHIIYLCLSCSVSTCVEPIRIAPLIYTCLLYSPVTSLFMAQSLELAYLESSASSKGQTYTFLRFTIISVIRTDKDVLSLGSDQLP